jgi:hypothetical protein
MSLWSEAPLPPVLAAMACRLVDPVLLALERTGGRPLDEKALSREILSGPPLFLTSLSAREAVDESFLLAPRALDCLATLSVAMVAFNAGRPESISPAAWDAISWFVDTDALVAWRLAERAPDWKDRVHLDSLGWHPVLHPAVGPFKAVLDREMAENHMHLGGAVPPAIYWTFLQAGTVPLRQIFSADASEWGDEMGRWERRIEEAHALAVSLHGWGGLRLRDTQASKLRGEALRGALRDVVVRRLSALLPAPRQRTREAWDAIERWPLGFELEHWNLLLVGLGVERQLLWECFRRLRGPEEDRDLEALLLEYLGIKNAFHHALLHGPGPRGLDRFQRSFQRQNFYFRATLRRSAPQRRIAQRFEYRRLAQVLSCFLVDRLGPDQEGAPSTTTAQRIEVRVSMASGRSLPSAVFAWCKAIRDVLLEHGDLPVQVGLVFHLRKERGDDALEAARFQALGLWTLLRDEPLLRPLIVGIDAAGPETASCPRNFAPIYAWFRRRLRDPDPCGGQSPISLGFTYHVGEDFRDLLTGLRHIDEAAHLLSMEPMDRLGHALALAWDPQDFYGLERRSLPRLGDCVLDLLWAATILGDRSVGEPGAESYARSRLERLVPGLSERWPQAMQWLSPTPRGSRANPDQAVLSEQRVLELLGLDAERSQRLVQAPGSERSWVEFVSLVQRVVQRRIQARSLVLELNPTSNLFIGEFTSHAELPYLRVNSFGFDFDGPRIRVCLNTDNPGIVNTTLGFEYERMGRAWVEAGKDPSQVEAWLENARRTGFDASFIPKTAPAGRALVQHLERILDPL